VALLASATAAIADDGDRAPALTLAEALAEARAQSPILGAAAEDGRRAAGLARAAAGVDDLVVEVEAEGLVRSSEAVAGAVFQDTELDAVAARAALWQPLPWGGRVGLEVREERARSTTRVALAGPASDVTTTIHSPSVALVWVQPLLRDRGRSAHTAGRRAAALAVEAEGRAPHRRRGRGGARGRSGPTGSWPTPSASWSSAPTRWSWRAISSP
jgi:hypothetical protein